MQLSIKRSLKWAPWRSSHRRLHSPVQILPEVNEALKSGRPVVALESTIIAHGMPYPQNLELAQDVSCILRSKGVIPATIAVKNGKFRAGLYPEEIEDLAKSGEEGRAIKCSTRDLSLIASSHYQRLHAREAFIPDKKTNWGATTVAATMRLAHAAGISTFVTGGTGGVHRGGELSLDISTDLIELSRTPVVVVSAGVKSILDIKRTLEVLETFGVPTGAWCSDDFPAFFSPVSGVKAPATFNDSMHVAYSWKACRDLGMLNGMLVAVPNNDPAGSNVEAAIKEALKEASDIGIEGRDLTPFILKNVAEKTGGDSLRRQVQNLYSVGFHMRIVSDYTSTAHNNSNIALVKNNAAVGADIATSISDIVSNYSFNVSTLTVPSAKLPSQGATKSNVVCVGGSVIDTVAKPSVGNKMILGTSNPGKIHRSDGGVGRNIAETLGRLGSKPIFYTAVGNDEIGRGLLERLEKECGVVTMPALIDNMSTAQYYALNDQSSSLIGAIADMDILAHIPIPLDVDLKETKYIVLDANLPADKTIETASRGVQAGCKVCFEPTSVPKSQAFMHLDILPLITYAFPNEDELFAMAKILDPDIEIGSDNNLIEYAASTLLFRMKSDAHIVITLGERGVMLAKNQSYRQEPIFKYFSAEIITGICSSNGPGDTLCGAFIHALLNGSDSDNAIRFGMKSAILSLRHESSAISPELSSQKENLHSSTSN